MPRSFKLMGAALAIVAAAAVSTSASAAVVAPHSPSPMLDRVPVSRVAMPALGGAAASENGAQLVQYRRGWRGGRGWRGRGWHGGRRYYGGRRWYRDRWVGPAIGAGIAALIIGGSVAESRSRYGDRWDQCASTYRSFDWSDGTFQPYGDGPRRVCPYLTP